MPTLTWVSDINAVILNGFKPVFVDINLSNLSMNVEEILKKINKKTLGFYNSCSRFNGLTDRLLKILKRKNNSHRRCLESHGAKHRKLGTYGLISNFSFYYAHHLTTIEGGMICTNEKKIYELARIFRSHGMARESGNKIFEKNLIKKHKDLSPKFIFLYPTFNFRNNEIGATIGINQLKKLDINNSKRTKNFKYFLNKLDAKKYWKDFLIKGSSNYAFPIILKTKSIKIRNNFEKYLKNFNIEFRRGNAGGGNQLRQPYLKRFINSKISPKKFKNVEHVHFFGYYIGNYPDLKFKKINQIVKILNSFKFN